MLLSHCRTVEEAAQRSISALQEHMAERQANHSKMQLVTEVESSALKVFGAYSLIMSSNVSISNHLISNSLQNKKSFRNTVVYQAGYWNAFPVLRHPGAPHSLLSKGSFPPSAVTPTSGTAALLRGDPPARGTLGPDLPRLRGAVPGTRK